MQGETKVADYSDRLSEVRLFKALAEKRKIRYFRALPGPNFTLSFADYKAVDPVSLALFLVSAERAFGAHFSVAFGGYGCFKVSYTVVAESREEAEKIARYMVSSKKVKNLTETAVLTELVIQSLESSDKASQLLANAVGTTPELKQIEAALAVVEEEMEIEPKPNSSPKDRLERLRESAVKEPPSSDSSFWRLGDMIGGLMGGLTKSMGGG